MKQYTLDYSRPRPKSWARGQRPNRRMRRAFRQVFPLLCGLLFGIALVGFLRMRSEVQFHYKRYQKQVIQYDSLLEAKMEADRQLNTLRTRLLER